GNHRHCATYLRCQSVAAASYSFREYCLHLLDLSRRPEIPTAINHRFICACLDQCWPGNYGDRFEYRDDATFRGRLTALLSRPVSAVKMKTERIVREEQKIRAVYSCGSKNGADGGGRTHPLSRVLDFESSASANSATSAPFWTAQYSRSIGAGKEKSRSWVH